MMNNEQQNNDKGKEKATSGTPSVADGGSPGYGRKPVGRGRGHQGRGTFTGGRTDPGGKRARDTDDVGGREVTGDTRVQRFTGIKANQDGPFQPSGDAVSADGSYLPAALAMGAENWYAPGNVLGSAMGAENWYAPGNVLGSAMGVATATARGERMVVDLLHDVGSLSKSNLVYVAMAPMRNRRAHPRRGMTAEDQKQALLGTSGPSASTVAVGCKNCSSRKHETGQCPVPSKHGDTAVDNFCNSRAEAQGYRDTHTLDAEAYASFDANGAAIGCAKMIQHYERHQWEDLFEHLVYMRRRMPPLRVRRRDFCFLRILDKYSWLSCGGDLPPQLEGKLPYTKDDAIKHSGALKRFDEIGMENMPPGELEGLTMNEIRMKCATDQLREQIFSTRPRKVKGDPSDHKMDVAELARGGDEAIIDLTAKSGP